MYAQPAPPVSPSASTPRHTAAELRYLACDDLTGIVAFTAPSAHRPGHRNAVSYDAATGATHCDCKGARCGHACWHEALVAAAWADHPARREVRALTAPRLLAYGKKAAAMLTVYRARTGRVLPLDAVNLLAARCEYRDRLALANAPLAA